MPQATLPDGEAACADIRQLELRGEEAGRFGWVLDSVAGPDGNDSPLRKCLGAKGIDIVIERAQAALRARGYVTTRILLQPQDLTPGTLALTVIPGRIRAIRYAASADAREGSLNAVPMRAGDILDAHDIEQALENFKRVPTADASIDIEGTDRPDRSDLVISYKAGFPFRVALSADDGGTRATGRRQGGVTFSYDNWWTLNDLFYVSINHDLGGGDAGRRGTRGGAVHYSLPLGYWTLAATAGANRYFQTVAGASQDYIYSGTSRNTEVRLSRLLHRDAASKTTASLKAFARESTNFIDDTEIQVQRRRVGGWEMSVGHRRFVGAATLEGNLAYRRGTGAFGSMPAPEEAFGEGTSRFALVTADASLNVPFEVASQPLRYSASWRAQFNRTTLTPQDRFAIGGRYTVRGFDGESSLSAERGWLLRSEVGVALGQTQQELYAGLDHGRVAGPSSGLLVGTELTGAVIGLRGALKGLQYDVFAGTPVRRPKGFTTSRVTLGFQLNYSL